MVAMLNSINDLGGQFKAKVSFSQHCCKNDFANKKSCPSGQLHLDRSYQASCAY
jgi:hypothetical protein